VIDASRHPALARIVGTVLDVWPDHARFLDQSLAGRNAELMQATERLAAIVARIAAATGSLTETCEDYSLLCRCLMEEELHFRRHGAYRLSRFEDAVAEVYANATFMARYMNFLLASYVLWENHARAIVHFQTRYLPPLPPGAAHLEIGPGHGLLLHLAAASTNVASATGWDISATSIARTRACLAAMDAPSVTLVEQNLFAGAADRRFDSVVLAEILEHLEDPIAALKAVAGHMNPGARLWVHVPVNSPAPDHIYLLRTPEEAVDLVRAGGFEPTDVAFFPMSGQTLERARKRALTISAVVSARRVN